MRLIGLAGGGDGANQNKRASQLHVLCTRSAGREKKKKLKWAVAAAATATAQPPRRACPRHRKPAVPLSQESARWPKLQGGLRCNKLAG